MLAWLVVAVLALVWGPPLGHDESAFALIARGDAPPWLYRSRGVVVLDEIGVRLGGSAIAIRAPFALLAAGLVLGAYAVGRAAFEPRVGAWAAAVMASGHVMALRSADALGDIPAAAFLLAGVAVLIVELSRVDGARWRIVLAAPCLAGAFYFRYASAPVIVLIGAAAAAVWWRSVARRPWPIVAAVGCAIALLVPHVLHSIHETDSWRGVLDISRNMPRRAYYGEGLVTYLTSNPFAFYGVLVAPVALVGLVTWWRSGRAGCFLAIVAIGQLISLGVQSHAQPRYVFVAVALLVVLGVRALVGLARPRLALVVVSLAWLGVAIAVIPYQRRLADLRAPYIAASDAIRADAGTQPCLIAARIVPQLMWYSRCEGLLVGSPEDVPPSCGAQRLYVVSLPLHRLDVAELAQCRTVHLPTRDDRARVDLLP